MKNLAYVTLHGYGRDVIFAGASAPRFAGAYLAERRLRDALREKGIDCHTPDVMPLERFDAFFFRDMPRESDEAFRYARASGRPMFLNVWENPYIHRPNADHARFADFRKVFSFRDDDVRLRGCVKLNYALPLEMPPEEGVPFNDRRFACMVSSLVKKNRPHCCSYLRLRTIRFYERNHPELFDLWGAGWEKGTYALQDRPGVFSALAACRINRLLPRVSHPSWRGECDDKVATSAGYRFAYCYENSTELAGYVTEKLFDVLSAGTVPVYLAHPSDMESIPGDCFIDRSRFSDDAELFDRLALMDGKTWLAYRDAGRRFLESAAARRFSFEAYIDTIVSTLAPAILETENGKGRV